MAGLGLPTFLSGALQGYMRQRGVEDDRQLRREDQEYRHRIGGRAADRADTAQGFASDQNERLGAAERRAGEKFKFEKSEAVSEREKRRRQDFTDAVGRWMVARVAGDEMGQNTAFGGMNESRDKKDFPIAFATSAPAPTSEEEFGVGDSTGTVIIDDEGNTVQVGGQPFVMTQEQIKSMADAHLLKAGGKRKWAIKGGHAMQTEGYGAGLDSIKRLSGKSKGFAASKWGIFSKDTGKYVPGQNDYVGGGGKRFTPEQQRAIASEVRQLVDRAFGARFNDKMGGWEIKPKNPALAVEAMSLAVQAYMDGKMGFPNPTTAAEHFSVHAHAAQKLNMTLTAYLKKYRPKNQKAASGTPPTADAFVNKHSQNLTGGGEFGQIGVPKRTRTPTATTTQTSTQTPGQPSHRYTRG